MGGQPEQPDQGEQPPTGGGMVGGRNLPAAIVVGLALAGLFLGSLFWHPAAFAVVVAGLTITAYLEVNRVLIDIGLRIDRTVLAVATVVMLFGTYQAGQAGQVVGVGVLVLGAVVSQLSDIARRDVARRLSTTLLFGLWIGFLASFAVLLVNLPEGHVAVLAVVGVVIVNDIGAFGFGVGLGRHKLAPSISPNKSLEGLVGGLVVAVVAAVLVLPNLGDTFDMVSAGVLALACALAAVLGDLVESMVKRDLGVKDFGRALPGHGGVLDRVDSILFALPVGYYTIELLT